MVWDDLELVSYQVLNIWGMILKLNKMKLLLPSFKKKVNHEIPNNTPCF